MVALATRKHLIKRPTNKRRCIAIDTETTGLFVSKGCRAFTVSACTDDAEIYLWKFKVDPFTREVHYPKSKLKDISNTLSKFNTVVFHNANYDLQALQALGLPYKWFFDNFDVHDTMIMSHAYKSDNRHGLKENAVLYLDYPDDDETSLSEITKSARTQAKKLGWAIADVNNLHPTLEGTQKEVYRSDYWVPEQIAIELGYPATHRWRTICDEYAGKDAERTMGLFLVFEEMLLSEKEDTAFDTCRPKQRGTRNKADLVRTGTLYDKYDEARQLIYPLLDMQTTGIPVKPRALANAKKLFEHNKEESLETLKRLAGTWNFNPGSPKQLQKALFETFKFKPVKSGKSGPSTDKDTITKLLSEAQVKNNKLPEKYQFLVALKEYRKETTTLQYINNYDKHSRPTPNRPNERVIQPFFSQTRTGTGRLSCTDPNTTNVGKKDMSNPFADDKDKVRATLFSEILGIDTDHRFSLRNVFGPKRGQQWTCIDYDQFQLRIFAVVSESYNLIEGFERGDDIHQLVARTIFNKDEISDVERTAAKAINFGLLFGAGPAKIELLAGVPGLYTMFTANFPKAKVYLDTQSRLARTRGYVHTVGGYRLYVPRNAPHAASCYVIQGTEAEIVKRAMVGVHEHQLNAAACPYRLLMMVHDELVFTSVTPTKNTQPIYDTHLSTIMNTMEGAGKEIGIPCKVDAKITTTDWATRSSLEFERLAV